MTKSQGDVAVDAVPRLRLAITRLARRLRQHATVTESMTPSRLSALTTIARRGPCRLSDVAEKESIGKSSVTRIATKLERDGLISRVPDPHDRRSALLVTTSAGEKVLISTNQRADEYLRAQFDGLDDADVAAIVGALTAIERMLELRA